MMRTKTVIFCALFFTPAVLADYWDDRSKFLRKDASWAVGASLELNDEEKKVNDLLMSYKLKEYDDGFLNPEKFLPAQHFFTSRNLIEESEVFKIIKSLPKGASLHSHDSSMVSEDFLFNLTYRDNLYECSEDNMYELRFFKKPDSTCKWRLVSDLRRSDNNYDNWLRGKMTLRVDDPKRVYKNINLIWKKFMSIFGVIVPMLNYKPVWIEYLQQVMQELYEDNVMYLEFRGVLPNLYDLNGKIYDDVETVQIYKDTIDEFKKSHPTFIGAKFIYGPSRLINNKTMTEYVKTAKILKKSFPKFLAGFDLVGQEDKGNPLEDFVDDLQEIGEYMDLFFHAGETNWFGSSSDLNLIDAVLLGTKRIGHGFAVIKHPEVLRAVKNKRIAIEISPISNQVLMLVDDLRNHPGNVLMAFGLPVVICNDDPSFWGAKGLSYDWYMAFMGMASREADLRMLKQLAINSILYSSMDGEEQLMAISRWQEDWKLFLNQIYAFYSNKVSFK